MSFQVHLFFLRNIKSKDYFVKKNTTLIPMHSLLLIYLTKRCSILFHAYLKYEQDLLADLLKLADLEYVCCRLIF